MADNFLGYAAPEAKSAADHAAELTALRESNACLAGQLAELTAAYQALRGSTSWRLTAPLRHFGSALPWLRTPLRRSARLAWWIVTFQVGRRLVERRAALAAAAQPPVPPAAAEAPSPTSFPVPKDPPAFDRNWYLAAYPEVAEAGVDPLEHYTAYGKGEGRHPTQAAAEEAVGFDRTWYLAAYPDVAAAGMDPFRHWLDYGKAECFHCNAHFSFSPRQLAVLAKSYHYKGHETAPSSESATGAPLSVQSAPSFDSSQYWRARYHAGGNSGAGSYGRLAAFKAEIINAFVREHDIASVIEFGCGDGAQLALADYPSYLGFDVADESVDLCRSKFTRDSTKEFRNAATWNYEYADLTLSLDVIYHLIEDEVFHEYMRRLFTSAKRYVAIYSSNREGEQPAVHVKHRRFTDWIDIYHADFKLVRFIPNAYPLVTDDQTESFADFFIFEKQPTRKHALPGHLVVSLTSYAKRFPTLELTLRRILQQSVQPDDTILWIAPEDLQHLPKGVLALRHSGLTIRETRDIRSYKKIIPALQNYPDSFIITLDDDLAYPLDTIEPLVTNYRSSSEILCRRAHRITFDDSGNLKPYNQWQFESPRESGSDLFATGGAGALYPPRCLAPEVLDEATFTTLAPLADDIWLFWMEHLAGSALRRVGLRHAPQPWPGCNEQGLWVNHNAQGGNDRVIAALTARYGLPVALRKEMPTTLAEIERRIPNDHHR
jgi:hypothetical protein